MRVIGMEDKSDSSRISGPFIYLTTTDFLYGQVFFLALFVALCYRGGATYQFLKQG